MNKRNNSNHQRMAHNLTPKVPWIQKLENTHKIVETIPFKNISKNKNLFIL